jgi:RNA polymerase sigma factor (sigma-70 family)
MTSCRTLHSTFDVTTDTTVFIVDDDPDLCVAVSLLVRSVQLRAIVFASADEFLEAYDPHQPGCLVLDVRLPGMTGLELQNQLNARGIRLPVIMVTAHAEIPLATQAMRAGALDFLQKPYSPHTLLERIFEALKLDRELRDKSSAKSSVEARLAALTEREREVMMHLVHGKSTKRIARELGISPKTVDNHRIKILEKLDVQNTVQLANLIIGKGEE